MVSFMTLPLYSRGKSLQYPLHRNHRAGVDEMENRKFLPFPEI
jgi:hypothetical protein